MRSILRTSLLVIFLTAGCKATDFQQAADEIPVQNPSAQQDPSAQEEKRAAIIEAFGEDAFITENEFKVDDMVLSLEQIDLHQKEHSDDAPSRVNTMAYMYANYKWPNGIIPVKYESEDLRRRIQKACSYWGMVGNIYCPDWKGEDTYLDVKYNEKGEGNGGGAYTGYIKGRISKMNLPHKVVAKEKFDGTLNNIEVHELGHVLGLWHEHQRVDRDRYVRVNWNAVTDGSQNAQYSIVPGALNPKDTATGPYDFLSVMHYGKSSSKIGSHENALIALPPFDFLNNSEAVSDFGNSFPFSGRDAAFIASMYPGAKRPGYRSVLRDVTTPLLQYKSRYTIRTAKNFYVTAEKGGGTGSVLNANRTAIGDWETFRAVPVGDGYMALKTFNNTYVTAHKDTGALYGDRTVLGDWEKFKVYATYEAVPEFRDLLLVTYYGKIVSPTNGGGTSIYAKDLVPDINERLIFKFKP